MHKQFILILVAIFSIGGAAYVVSDNDTAETPTESVVEVVETQEAEPTIEISEDGTYVSYDGVEGETPLATMQGLTDVVTQSSDFGEFVTTINGLEADSSSQYWAFYVNGELANLGAGNFTAEAGDSIEWRLEEF